MVNGVGHSPGYDKQKVKFYDKQKLPELDYQNGTQLQNGGRLVFHPLSPPLSIGMIGVHTMPGLCDAAKQTKSLGHAR